jgi:aspartyl-tRNA(Asn)/glutamyl-tRNA(Gln) amidotransferase subunit A
MLRTIESASREIKAGRLSPSDLLDECLQRIERVEPHIKAWVVIDREGASRQAVRLTSELRSHLWRGPLHGIPIGVKDIIDVDDLPTAAGYRPWAQSIARQDATAVERLRAAGAVILGKVVTTQFASFDPPSTRNPWNLERTPGGSSSGSAAAVASGMCLGALGTQTGGSIIRPASYCGVAACKPTYGRVSLAGVVPLAPSMDHIGPMAGCVHDLAILLGAIAGADPRDPTCENRAVPYYLSDLEEPPKWPHLSRLRGIFEDFADPIVRKLVDEVCLKLKSASAAIDERALPAGFEEILPRQRMMMAVEAAVFHEERLKNNPEEYGPCIRSLLEEGIACSAPEFAETEKHRSKISDALLSCFDDVDALIMPATTRPAPDRATTGDPAFNAPWSYTGFPVVSIPAGWSDDKMPLAIQLVGRPWDEARLFRVAAWCEKVLGFERQEPPI